MSWKIIKKQIAFDNKWRRVDRWDVEMPNGEVGDFYFSVGLDIAMVFALTLDKQVIAIKQYHIYFDHRTLQIPAGFIEDGDTPLEAAKKELREETGYVSDNWEGLGKTHLGRWSTNNVYYFFAQDAYKAGEQELEGSEDITVELPSLDSYISKLRSGEVENTLSLTCSYMALDYLQKL